MKKTINITPLLASLPCALLHPYASANEYVEKVKSEHINVLRWKQTVVPPSNVIAGQKDFGERTSSLEKLW